MFRNRFFFFYCEGLLAPCHLSAVAYSMYSQLPSVVVRRHTIRNSRKHHAAVTGTHLYCVYYVCPEYIENIIYDSFVYFMSTS
jgi:hypothetical protein